MNPTHLHFIITSTSEEKLYNHVFSIYKLVTKCWFLEGFLNNKVKHSNLIDAFNQANTQIGHAFKFVGQPMVFIVIWISFVWERKKIQTVNQVQK